MASCIVHGSGLLQGNTNMPLSTNWKLLPLDNSTLLY